MSSALVAVAMSFVSLVPASAQVVLEIVNQASGLRVDVIGASTNEFQGVFLWPDNSSASQEFYLELSRNGYYHLRARHSGQCLMLDWRDANRNGTKVIQFPGCDDVGYLPSQWFLGSVRGPNCTPWCTLIVNRYTKKCLDAGNAAGGAPGPRAILQQWDCISWSDEWNAGNQIWHFARTTSGVNR